MTENARSPFRRKAIETYMRKQDETVFPSFVAPRFFIYLWALGVFAVIGAFVVWSYQVPVYTNGVGVIYEPEALVVFLIGDERDNIRAGQKIEVVTQTGQRLHGTVDAVLPDLASPQQARNQFNLDASTGLLITEASTVILAELPETSLGSIYRVDIVTDTKRLISYFPVIGEWFE